MNNRRKIPEIEKMVVGAIRSLQELEGSNASAIVNYISRQFNIRGPEVRRQINSTLRKGVEYGILEKARNGFQTCDWAGYTPTRPVDPVSDCSACMKRKSRHRKSKKRGKCGSKSGRGRKHGMGRRQDSSKSSSGSRGRRSTKGGRQRKSADGKSVPKSPDDGNKCLGQQQGGDGNKGSVSNPPSNNQPQQAADAYCCGHHCDCN